MKDNISPEEKLLKLIKEDKKIKNQHLTNITPHPNTNRTTQMKTSDDTKDMSSSLYFLRKYLTIQSLHTIIILLIVLSGIYLLFSIIYPLIYLKKVDLLNIPKITAQSQVEKEEMIEPLDSYLQKTKKQQIFGGFTAEQTTSSTLTSIAQGDLLKDLSLVGVITGVNPQAIIEDKKAQKTYYVTTGQSIGEYLIEDIQEGKIILNYNGQKYELHM